MRSDGALMWVGVSAWTGSLDYVAEYNYFLVQVFQEVDTDDDGCITVEQLREVLGVRTEEHEGDLQKILAQMQLEEDGSIDYIEFLHTFTDRERHG
jgi:Ca2+-binding EF-hand superfamily protein